MYYCRIENGVVVDRVVFDTPMPVTWPDYDQWQQDDAAQIGWTIMDGVAVPPIEPILERQPLTKVYRSTFVSRCSEAELTTLTNHLATENIKFREMYAACDYFLTTDSMFAVLYWTVASLLGSEQDPNFTKADELLAPEE